MAPREIPPLRLRDCNGEEVRGDGDFVLYWMTAARRTRSNFALEHAALRARALQKPLVVLEALRCGYRWASDRLHRFVLDGMRDNADALAGAGVLYYPYVEPEPGAGKGLLAALGRRAALVVTDDFPSFFLPRMLASAARQLPVRLEAVDSNGLLPLRATEKVFLTAHSFRRFLQGHLLPHLEEPPRPNPLARLELPAPRGLPREVRARWPARTAKWLERADLSELRLDHEVAPTGTRGGAGAAGRALKRFLRERLGRYAEDRNRPQEEVTSELSPYLHFGHLSAHDVFAALARQEGWSPARVSGEVDGRREGFWGLSAPAEAFVDQLVTWRELGYNRCALDPDHDRYETLPDWARATLDEHAADPRPHLYDLAAFERAETHDPLWNAAQNQLVREGRIHNYLRMLWGKKVLEWSRSPREALAILIELNNRYALDGRNPNSYSGIFWIFGRYDRPWGPERPIFGKVRYMTSANTARKVRVVEYVERYGSRA